VCYSALEDFSGEHLTCWPGYEAIAKKVGCSARWIPVLLKRLVEAGLLVVQYRQGKTNIYTLLGRVAAAKGHPGR
jgi:predicted transcriptional regulator